MKFKKGFTLIELLGVIIIMGIIVLIVTISVNNIINASKEGLTNIQINEVEKVAEVYYLNEGINNSNLEEDFVEDCVNVDYLLDKGYFNSSSVINPNNHKNISGSVKITFQSGNYLFEFQTKSCQ